LLNAYSSLSLMYNGSSGGNSFSETSTYTTIYASATTYKVNMSETVNGSVALTSTMWILKNGTALAVDYGGYNVTGAESSSMELGFFAGFTAEAEAASQLSMYTASGYFHSTGTSTVTIGSATFPVTTYAANSLPETINNCGDITVLNTYSLSVGTPTGATAPLVTSIVLGGTDTSNGQTTSVNYQIKLVAITVR
jgi:hypothetical protein